MRKRVLLSLLLSVLLCDSTMGAVARRTGRTQTNTNQQSQTKQTAARAATGARTAPRATTGSRTTSARSAKPTATTANNTPQKTVAARAGTTQKIINTGTSVASASQNVLIDKTCQEKYNGCMDSFCMLNNANGGRCVCSDRNDELNNALAEIEKTDELSYQMATVGVEQLEMGLDADAAIKMSANVVESLKAGEKNVTSTKSVKSRNLSFDAWDGATQTEQNIFAASSTSNDITDKTGDELYTAAMNICASQIPECKSSLESVQLLYAQQVKSDCLAFENTLKKRRAESNEKLQAAERALRDTALEQHQIQNKYDLGQCSAKFKECIQTTA
ncbi:MAG: hypothetical protein J6R99_05020, partial [Alphaproteobacteria bacterium]|nr:hypothetical protein [Alphaproteobacteria bacterium]